MTTMLFQGPNFTLQVPTDWLITATPQVQVLFLAPETAEATIRPNLAVSVSAVSDSATVADIANTIVQTQRQSYAEYAILANRPVEISGQPGVELQYTWQNDARMMVAQTQRLVRVDEWVHSLTVTQAAHGDPLIAETLRAILESFRFKGN